MKNTIFLLLFPMLACDPVADSRLQLYNTSYQPVVFLTLLRRSPTVKLNQCTASTNSDGYLVPGEIVKVNTAHGGDWERLINEQPFKSIFYYTYNADSLAQYIINIGCDSLVKREDLALKKFIVTVDYLNKNNWTLTYP